MITVFHNIRLEDFRSVANINVLQLPVHPIPPPPIDAEILGKITWDLPSVIRYSPNDTILTTVEMINPTDINRWYVIGYYFLDENGNVVSDGYIEFMVGDIPFTAFRLPPIAEAAMPAFFELGISSPYTNCAFGLRMLLCEMVGHDAVVIQETSRLHVVLSSGYGGIDTGLGVLLAGLIITAGMVIVSKAIVTK